MFYYPIWLKKEDIISSELLILSELAMFFSRFETHGSKINILRLIFASGTFILAAFKLINLITIALFIPPLLGEAAGHIGPQVKCLG
jgi:hypothetical protein